MVCPAFVCVFVCLFVCLLATARENYWSDLHGYLLDVALDKEVTITIQTIVENVYVWLVGPRRPVSER